MSDPPARALPDWLQAYLLYTHESESPEAYHLWVSMSVISGVLRRNVYFNMGYFSLYPNLYAILVGPAGRCKKSTAMSIGRGILSTVPGVNFTTDSVTRERLIQDLAQSHNDGVSAMTAFSSEFASMLTSSGMDMVVFLTDIFDCPLEWSHRTKMGGTNKIKGPYLNLLGATTPDWIAKAMPLDTVGIGLTSRIIFVYQNTPRKRHWRPILSSDQKAIREKLISDLALISTLSGEYQLDTSAEGVYAKWYLDKFDDAAGDPRLAGYYERKHIHILKAAMVVAASRRQELVIIEQDIKDVLILMEQNEQTMIDVFASVGKNPLAFDIGMVASAVHAAGPDGLPFSILLDKFKHSVRRDELFEVLDVLITINEISVDRSNKSDPKYFSKGG